jgi:NADH dehydrogenase
MSGDATKRRVQVVILGGGFAGIGAALEFGRQLRHAAEVDVHLVSEENYCVFQPMLPEVVAGGIEPTHIVNPVRQLCVGMKFHCARVEAIDAHAKSVKLVGADGRQEFALPYDHLVLALGQVVDLSRVPGMTQHALPIKTLGDAFHLRNQVLSRLEQADLEPDDARRKHLLTFVTVGGGFSGVETAAEIHDLIRRVLPFYPNAWKTGHRMVLIHSRERILNELPPSLGDFAQKTLARRGVEILTNLKSVEATADGVKLSDGRFLGCGTLICTIGNAPHPLISNGEWPQDGGRVVTDDCMRVTGRDGVWALGDMAAVPDRVTGGICPPTAQYAIRQGRQLARNVLAAVHGAAPQPFRFKCLGQLAVVGHHCGVAMVLGMKFSGVVAWMMWRAIYWSKLPSFVSKVRVGLDWALDLVFPRDLTKFETRRTEAVSLAHYRPGDVIVRQGERGDCFYVIQKGRVEIVRADAAATAETRLGEKGPGESFGEAALVNDAPRNATVRALTAVDVLAVSRGDFKKLVASYGAVREQVERDLARHAAAPIASAKAAPPS